MVEIVTRQQLGPVHFEDQDYMLCPECWINEGEAHEKWCKVPANPTIAGQFADLQGAWQELRDTIYESLHIEQITIWLNNGLKRVLGR